MSLALFRAVEFARELHFKDGLNIEEGGNVAADRYGVPARDVIKLAGNTIEECSRARAAIAAGYVAKADG